MILLEFFIFVWSVSMDIRTRWKKLGSRQLFCYQTTTVLKCNSSVKCSMEKNSNKLSIEIQFCVFSNANLSTNAESYVLVVVNFFISIYLDKNNFVSDSSSERIFYQSDGSKNSSDIVEKVCLKFKKTALPAALPNFTVFQYIWSYFSC